jgi:hypothetical protein
MSSTYNANGTLVSATNGQTQVPIASSTNPTAFPYVIQTSFAHGYNSGDYVEIEGHLVNTGVNGRWTITVIDSTHFSLNGTAGGGGSGGGATGYCVDYSMTPTVTFPADGELITAAVANSPVEASLNVGPWLYRMAGRYRLLNIYETSNGSTANPPVWDNEGSWSATSYTTITHGADLFTGLNVATQATDLFHVTWSFMASLPSVGTGNAFVTLGFNVNGGSYSPIGGAPEIWLPGAGSVVVSPTFDYVFVPGASTSWNFAAMMRLQGSGPISAQFIGASTIRVNHYRFNA